MIREFPGVTLHRGDCLDVMRSIEAGSVDAVVTDPPYGLAFMGKSWDHGVPGVEFWQAALTTAKPGAFLAAFGGTRTFHRLAVAIEDAGWEIRDTLCWHYGTGFPKSKACLKPGWEPVILAKSPGKVRELGIDECRIGTTVETWPKTRAWPIDSRDLHARYVGSETRTVSAGNAPPGRWPSNVLLTHSPECNGTCADGCPVKIIGEQGHEMGSHSAGAYRDEPGGGIDSSSKLVYSGGIGKNLKGFRVGDSGSVARFFYTSKASRAERGEDNTHPTVKPIAIMEWVTKLICPPGGTVLDPFIGSGTTALAALNTGRKCIGIERDEGYYGIACRRVAEALDKTALLNPIA